MTTDPGSVVGVGAGGMDPISTSDHTAVNLPCLPWVRPYPADDDGRTDNRAVPSCGNGCSLARVQQGHREPLVTGTAYPTGDDIGPAESKLDAASMTRCLRCR